MVASLIFGVNRDGYHMWGRKCSLFPEHANLGLCLGLFAWISLTALSRLYVIVYNNHLLNHSGSVVEANSELLAL